MAMKQKAKIRYFCHKSSHFSRSADVHRYFTMSVHLITSVSISCYGLVIIYREGVEGLVQIGGGPPFFMHDLKGGGGWGIKKYASVLPAKMIKAASGCHQQIQPIKIALYNIDLISTVNITNSIIIIVVALSI